MAKQEKRKHVPAYSGDVVSMVANTVEEMEAEERRTSTLTSTRQSSKQAADTVDDHTDDVDDSTDTADDTTDTTDDPANTADDPTVND